MIAALKLVGSTLLEYLALLFNPRVWVFMGLAGAIGWVGGCQDEQERFDDHLALEDKVVAVQEGHRLAVNARNDTLQEEVARESEITIANLSEQLDDADRQLRARAARTIPKPGAGASTVGPLQPGCSDGERQFLLRVYTGDTFCYDAGEMGERVRGALERALGRSRDLSGQALAAYDDSRWWGEWATKVGACKAETP